MEESLQLYSLYNKNLTDFLGLDDLVLLLEQGWSSEDTVTALRHSGEQESMAFLI